MSLTTRTTSSRGFAARRAAHLRAVPARDPWDAFMDDRHPVIFPRAAARPPPLATDDALDELERRLPGHGDGARVAISRVHTRSWEARLMDGTVGRGTCAGSAVADLLRELALAA